MMRERGENTIWVSSYVHTSYDDNRYRIYRIQIMININACAPLTLVFCSDPRRVAPLAIANKAAADRRKSFMVVMMLMMLMML